MSETQQPKKWLKGHLRDANAASKCAYLRPTMHGSFEKAPVVEESGLVTAANEPEKTTKLVTIQTGPIGLVLQCLSPDIHFFFAQTISDPDVKKLVLEQGVSHVTLDFCRLCPFYLSIDSPRVKKDGA